MYNFIFYCLYSQQKKKGKSDTFARFNGSLVTGLTLAFHLGFIIVVARAIYFNTIHYHYWSILDAVPLKIVCFLIMSIPFFYYNKERVERIKKHYHNEYLSLSALNVFKFILILILPLLVIIKLSSK